MATPTSRRCLTVVVLCIWIGGVVGRYEYGAIFHNPRHNIVSDARQLTDTAERMLASPASQELYDTVWPPGTPAVLALLLARDGSLTDATLLLILLSSLMPLIVGHTAFLVGGRGPALFAVALSSIHFGFIHYTGFFLTEELFQFAAAVAIWITIAALIINESLVSRKVSRTREIVTRLLLGIAMGVTWALAASFRPNALPIAGIVGATLSIYWLKRRRFRSMWIMFGSIVGLTLMIAPLTYRCSSLKHGFCAVSTNGPMNIALGQLDHAAGIEFFDPTDPYLNTGWWPPALAQHGYTGTVRLPFTMYDDHRIWRWISREASARPFAAMVRVGRNVIDLFRFSYWPENPLLGEWFILLSTVVIFVLVILPGICGMYSIALWIRKGRTESALPIALFAILLGVCLVAGVALGEPRYRFPFDGVFIMLAAMMLCGIGPHGHRDLDVKTLRVLPWAVGGIALVSIVGGLMIAMVSSAEMRFAERFRPNKEPKVSTLAPDVHSASDFERPFPTGTAWNASGVYRFMCRVECRELRMTFGGRRYSRAIDISVDDNDRYRVLIYRDNEAVGHVDIPRTYGGTGLRSLILELPGVATSGFDELGVEPLYGDGIYVLGHLRLVP